MELLSIQIGKAEPTPAKSGLTGHFKKPVPQAAVSDLGLAGDVICDTKHHGGVDQAVYIFGEEDRLWWEIKLGRPTPPGFFGENLLISDLCSAELVIGDIFAIGDVLLQITSPRIPCATYAAHIGSGKAIKDFYAAERPGAYARVLRGGTVKAGMQVLHQPFDGPKITIIDNMRAYVAGFSDDFLRKALQVPAHYKLHDEAKQRLNLA
ncbi:MOSC domain-containing protein [Loktanella sp. D2R18]|uniref:MOSC domain-containing protein n=1 Tax=Rhodobacterales TaxID=204455 RepID=UPI000DE9E2FB|nr:MULTISPECIES: MOSC domain-containing protein [Rhodobacterales]MDO6589669.1 MOSC domain-containing protein [Yoonia sp. 1_MG-2023]RBW44296.1 MOSC domain-containing protein [Loktanella sp. D2R18]